MATLTVIVTAFNSAEKLKYTLEGLVNQSTEEFDVVIVDNGSDEAAKSVIKEYCDDINLLYSNKCSNVFNTHKYDDLIIIDNTSYNNDSMPHNNNIYSQYMLYSNGNIGTTMKEDRYKDDK